MEAHRAEIFQLYIVQRKTLDDVKKYMKTVHGIEASSNMYKSKLKKWDYTRNCKRAVILQILRQADDTRVLGDKLISAQKNRPIDIAKVQKYCKRERLQNLNNGIIPTGSTDNEDLNDQTPTQMPMSLPVFQAWKVHENLLRNVDVLIKGSFESGEWSHQDNEYLIKSSPFQEMEKQSLHAFISGIDQGSTAALAGNMDVAGKTWQQAFTCVEVLVEGRYHDNIPNMIWKINDLNARGCTDFALLLKNQIASWSAQHQATDQARAPIFQILGQIDMDLMNELEERIMIRFVELFEFFLGSIPYNSFVMMMNAAHRRLSRAPWTRFEDCLPELSRIDEEFGSTNRRSLDIVRMRTEILHERGLHKEAEAEASVLVARASTIEDGEWQRLYFLTKRLYYRGISLHLLGRDNAVGVLSEAIRCEEDFCKVDIHDIFKCERTILQRHLENAQSRIDCSIDTLMAQP